MKHKKTPPSDKKELLKFLCKDIIEKFNSVGKIITELPEEEKEGCIRAVKTVAEQIGLIAERI